MIGDARQFLRGELRAPRSLQVARGTSRSALVQCTARMPCRILAKRLRIFAMQKYGSERCTDAARTATARNLIGSRESKNGRAVFLLLETLGNSCAGNFALRARCKSRTARNLIGSRESKNGRAVFLLLETHRIVAHCSESYRKSRVEKRPSRFSFVGDAQDCCALLAILCS